MPTHAPLFKCQTSVVNFLEVVLGRVSGERSIVASIIINNRWYVVTALPLCADQTTDALSLQPSAAVAQVRGGTWSFSAWAVGRLGDWVPRDAALRTYNATFHFPLHSVKGLAGTRAGQWAGAPRPVRAGSDSPPPPPRPWNRLTHSSRPTAQESMSMLYKLKSWRNVWRLPVNILVT